MSPLSRVLVAASAAATLTLALSACVPEPVPGAVPTPAASPSSSSAAAPAETPTASPTPSTTPTTAAPASCDEIYSDAMRATLEEENPPLNDPGVTLLSTEQAPLLELLDAVPTLRCSWGTPSERGLATNVSIVDAAQATTIRDTLTSTGFGCEDSGDATVCRIEQRGVSLDDVPYERGEVQALRGDVWVSTSWINFDPEGYTEDILATVAE